MPDRSSDSLGDRPSRVSMERPLCMVSPRAPLAAADVLCYVGDEEEQEVLDDRSHATAWTEIKGLCHLAFPVVLQNTFGFLTALISAAFVGHLGSAVLSSVVMATSLYNVTGLSVIVGLASGMETMCGQAYGAKNYKVLGVVLQRAVLICWAACVPIVILQRNAAPFLALMNLPPEVVIGASRYLSILSPTLFTNVLVSTMSRYLMSQRIMLPNTYCTVIAACLCPLYNWFLIHKLNMGLDGAAYANVMSQCTSATCLLIYVFWHDMSMLGEKTATWTGLHLGKALQWEAVVQYLSYGVPAAAMICLEWWAFEMIIIIAGLLPGNADVAISSMGITFNINGVFYMISMAFGTAANTRIANSLGAGLAEAARRSFVIAVSVVLFMEVFFVAILWSLRMKIPRIFTDETAVVDMVGSLMPLVCASICADGLNAVFSGVLRGCGRLSVGAYLNLFGWWCMAVPLAVLLGIHQGMGTWGFWIALCVGTNIQAMVFLVLISRQDWDLEVLRAQVLVASHMEPVQLPGMENESAEDGLAESGGLKSRLLVDEGERA